MNLKEFKKTKSELEEKLSTFGKSMLVEEFRKFFDAHPHIKKVQWTQYTPHFNDGDVCEFGRHDFCLAGDVKLAKDTSYADHEDEDGEKFYSSWSLGGADKKAVEALSKTFTNTDDLFRATFGDGVSVIAEPGKFTVNDYDHD